MIIYKSFIRETFTHFAMILAAVTGIFIAIDFFQRIDNFLKADVPAAIISLYLLYKLPVVMTLMIPLCIFLAVIITLGLMCKHHELIALESCGISVYSLLKPVVFIGLAATLSLFFLSEKIVPETAQKTNQIWRDRKKNTLVVSKDKNIWFKDSRFIAYIKYYNKEAQTVFGVTLYYFDEGFRLARRIDARQGTYTPPDGWMLHDLMEQVLDKNTGNYVVMFHEKQKGDLPLTPDGLSAVVKKAEEMNFKELLDYIRKMESDGYDATPYRVDLHVKTSFPFVCLILCVIGLGISARVRMKEGLPVTVAFGMGLAFIYWVLHSFTISLGYGGIIPPPAAAWTANVVFGGAALLNMDGK
jgi:lipopolysaccharide export system permease protein